MNSTLDVSRAAAHYNDRNQTEAPPAVPPVHSAQAQLDEETGVLHQVISALYERLRPVLGPSGPATAEKNAALKSADTTVAQKIDASARSVRSARENLHDIINRLEV